MKIKSIGLGLLILALAGLLIGCKTSASDADGNRQSAARRDFHRILFDDQGVPILRISGEYIGKQPHQGYETDIPWLTVDTDFYNLGFENLTRNKIRFVSKKVYQLDPYEVRRGNINQPPSLVESIDFIKTPNSNFEELEPLENRKLINLAIHTDNQITHSVSNIVFRIMHLDMTYTFNIFLTYQK